MRQGSSWMWGCLFFIIGLMLVPAPIIFLKPTKEVASNLLPNIPLVQTNIQLISPGAEPRQLLRYAPRKNAKQTAQMTGNSNDILSSQGQTQSSESWSMKQTLQTKVTKVEKNGDIHVNFSYIDMDISSPEGVILDQNLEVVRAGVKKIVDAGLKGLMVVDSQGNLKELNLEPSKALNSSIQEWLQNFMNFASSSLFLPVPTESVGVGAVWQVQTTYLMDEITMNHVTTYELKGMSKNILALEFIVEEKSEAPSKPPKSNLNESIESINSQGRGMAAIRLNKIMPVNHNISKTSTTSIKSKVPDSKKEVLLENKSTHEVYMKSN